MGAWPTDHKLECKALPSAKWSWHGQTKGKVCKLEPEVSSLHHHVLLQNMRTWRIPNSNLAHEIVVNVYVYLLLSILPFYFLFFCFFFFNIRNLLFSSIPTILAQWKPHFSTSLAARWVHMAKQQPVGCKRNQECNLRAMHFLKNCLFLTSLFSFLGLELGRRVEGQASPRRWNNTLERQNKREGTRIPKRQYEAEPPSYPPSAPNSEL